MQSQSVYLESLGCRLNEAELEKWSHNFAESGIMPTKDKSQADLYVLNTCAVTQEACKKSRSKIRRFQRDNPNGKVIISGCYATLESDNLRDNKNKIKIDQLIPNSQKDNLVEIVTGNIIPHAEKSKHLPILETRPTNRTRAFIKVQDGCRNRCSYCIVTIARGDEKSKPIASVVEEVRELEKAGTKEVIISGVHLGGYGSDLDAAIKPNLKLLLEAILKHTSIPRIRLGSLEPWDIPDDFFELWQNPRLMPHLHLPLQSGSTPVLKRMARRCMTKTFEKLIADARAQVPNINITTDIIVGFPGETDGEFQESLDFIKKLNFGDIHIFSYSPRPGTKAAIMPNQIDAKIKKERSQILHKLCETLKSNYENNILSPTQKNSEILFETCTDQTKNIWVGHNKYNIKISKQFKPGFDAKNQIF